MIPLFRPSCSEKEIEYVFEVLRSGWWGMGPKVAELEEKFAAYTGSTYAVAVHSCTMAMQMTLQALQVNAGEVIMPALTFAATGLAALHNGARPVFADIDEDTLCIDWDDAESKVTFRTKAVMPVWYGGTVTTVPWSWFKSPLHVIEDCAHAAGSPYANQQGSIAACWSFNAVKNIACGDGGMVTTNDQVLAGKLRKLRRFGIDRPGWDFEIPEAGWKEDMNDISAAIALAQLERADELNKARHKIALRYINDLWAEELPWLRLPKYDPYSSWHMFVVRVERRDEFIQHMQANGVSAGVHYKPLNQHPIFGKCELPVTDRVWKTLVTLPLYPDMIDTEIEQVVAAVQSFR